jgi:hypothetical protein
MKIGIIVPYVANHAPNKRNNMTDQDQIKAIAELDGWEYAHNDADGGSSGWRHGKQGNLLTIEQVTEFHSYLTSRDAIVPVIDKICKDDVHKWCDVIDAFCKICHPVNYTALQVSISLMRATPSQLSEALLRATDKWKD